MKKMSKAKHQHNLVYAAELTAVVEGFGASRNDNDDIGYQFTMGTKAGKLSLSVRPNLTDIGATVFTRFDDVEAAKALGLSHLNPFSGKWNHHFFGDHLDDAIRQLRYEFGKVIA